MPNIKIRLSETERDMVRDYADFFGKPMTACVREAFLKEYYKHSGKIENYIKSKEE